MGSRQDMPFAGLFEMPLRNGLTKPKAVRGEGMKMVNMGEVFAHRRIHHLDMDRVPMEAKERNSSLLRAGDLLFARQSLVLSGAGKCVLFQGDNEDVTFESHIIRCRLDQQKAAPAFYFYLFQSAQGRSLIESIVEQVAAAGIRGSDLGRLVVPVPPLAEQKAIAAVLGALDDKIDLNRRMNATLEAMARALFQSWFVNFDPVRAKMDRRKPAGLSDDAAALFPNAFQDSELGSIPKGWKVVPLGELIELAYGKPLKAEDRKGGIVRVYGANGPVGWHNEKLVSGPGIVVGRKGSPGAVTWAHGDFYPIDTTFYVEPKHPHCSSLYFLFFALSNHDLANVSADSAVPGLNRNHAYMSNQVVPPAALLKAFDEQASHIFTAVYSNEAQSRTLAALRDALLPKLLSGEIRVSEAESLAERAA